MLGGIARRQTAIDQARDINPNLMVLHNGGLLQKFGSQAELKRTVQIKDLNKLDVSALGIAPSDFILGAGSLMMFQQATSFPVLASNLIDTKNQIKFLEESSLKQGEITVRFFSLIDQSQSKEVNRFVDSIQVEPIAVKIKEWKEQKKENEFWVLFFHGPVHQAQKLAVENDLFNLMIYNQQGEIPYYQRMKSVNMISTGIKGRYFIAADFESTPPFNLINNTRYTLDKNHSHDPFGDSLIADYKLELKNDQVAKKHPKVSWPEGATYVGSKRCALCHRPQYNMWKETKHAKAVEPLISNNSHFDPECLQCHTTGFEFKGGFRDLKKSKALGNVGCETCHGPRSLHVRNPRKFQNPTPTSSTCLQCHDAENSPKFEFDTYWPKVAHPKLEKN